MTKVQAFLAAQDKAARKQHSVYVGRIVSPKQADRFDYIIFSHERPAGADIVGRVTPTGTILYYTERRHL